MTEDWKHSFLILEDYELFVITKGILYLEYNNKQYSVSEGEMLLIPPVKPPFNARRGYESSSCSFYWMHFGIPDHPHDPTLSGSIPIPEHSKLAYPEKIIIMLKQLQDMVKAGSSKRSLNYMTTTVLCHVYDDVNSNYAPDNELKNINNKRTKKQLYNDMVDYIKQNIYTKLTVQEVAEHFGYNDKYVSRLFNRTCGLTLKQYIVQQKAEAANFFLTDTNLSIEEIAYKLAYSDSHNFTRSYKKQTGLTPTEYRNAFSKRVLNH